MGQKVQKGPITAFLRVISGVECGLYHLVSMSCVTLPNGMEEVIGSIPIRSTNYSNNLDDLALLKKGPIRACSHLDPALSSPATFDWASRLAGVTACA